MKEKKVSKFSWVYPFIIFSYLVFLGVFLIYYQVIVHKLERQVINLEAYNEELYHELDDLCDDLDDEFMFIENDIVKLNKRIDKLEYQLIDNFATYLVEYPPSGSICVYENGTLFVFKIVNDNLILDEIISYNELKELWFNK